MGSTRQRGSLARLWHRSSRAQDHPSGTLHPSAGLPAVGAPVVIVSQALGWEAAELRTALGPAWQVRRAAVDSAHLLVVGRADAIVIGPSPPTEVSRLRRRYPRADLVVVSPYPALPATVSTWLEAGADTYLHDPELATVAAHLRARVNARSSPPPPPTLTLAPQSHAQPSQSSGPGSVGPPSPNGAGAGPVGTGPGPAGRPAISGHTRRAGADALFSSR